MLMQANTRITNLLEVCALKGGPSSCCMVVNQGGEPDFCEECGSPLEDGFCHNCGAGFREGASPVGPAPLDRRELSQVLRRSVGRRAYGSYALSMQQEEGMAPLRKEIDALVEQFGASPEAKESVKQNAERVAVKLLRDLGPAKAAVVSVAQEFLMRGRKLTEVSLCVSRVHPRLGQLSDLVIEVYPTSLELAVVVNGRKRDFKSHAHGLYRKLRIQVFVWDDGATVELQNARLTMDGYDAKKVRPLGPSRFVLSLDERNFELFKLLEEAKLSGWMAAGGLDSKTTLKKYSISRLPFTERLLREAGLLQAVSAEYGRRFDLKMRDGRGRSPKKLAEEALAEACDRVVPVVLSEVIVKKYHLKPTAVKSLLVVPELGAWQE
jgi:hypothetical protein